MIITEVRLENNKIMNIISNKKTGEEAKALAIKHSPRLFGDINLYVTNEANIISNEQFNNKSSYISSKNEKEFMASFFMDNITQVLNIKSNEVSGAYNSIKLKYGIQEDVFMMIYEVNQTQNNKVSAVQLSKHIILTKDNYRINNILNKASEQMKRDELLYMHEYDISLLFGIIRDYCAGDYTWIHTEIVIKALANITHYINPDKFTIRGLTDIDMKNINNNDRFKDKYTEASYIILKTINNMNIDIKLYNKWLLKRGDMLQIT